MEIELLLRLCVIVVGMATLRFTFIWSRNLMILVLAKQLPEVADLPTEADRIQAVRDACEDGLPQIITALCLPLLCIIFSFAPSIAGRYLPSIPEWMYMIPLIIAFVSFLAVVPKLVALPINRWHLRQICNGRGLRLCIKCGYDLRKLEPPTLCPECGTPFKDLPRRISKSESDSPNE